MGTFFNIQHNNFFYLFFTVCITFLLKNAIALEGCQPPSKRVSGFDMSLYHYPYNTTNGQRGCFNDEYQLPDFQQGGYESYGGGLFGQASNIVDINLEIRLQELCTPTLGNLPSNFNYDETFTISNFTMLLTGYFLAEESGQYTFNVAADDLAYLSFGAGNAFECCREAGTVNKPHKFDLIVIWNGADNMSGSVSYDLQAGVYYPIRLLYANRDYHGDLRLIFQDPSGTLHNTFTDYIYQFPDNVNGCAKQITTTTRPGLASQTTTVATSTRSVTGSDGLVTIETVYVIETPLAKSSKMTTDIEDDTPYEETATATTIFSTGTGSVTSTLSTSTNTFTGSDGIVTTETVYIVVTPSSTPAVETATTTFTAGTGSVTSTLSTSTNTFTGSDGIITTETTYFVQTPSNTPASEIDYTTSNPGTTKTTTTYSTVTNIAIATTTFVQGTASTVTTYSTATNIFTGPDGIITTETTYFVETPSSTPAVETATTTFTAGTASVTSTYSTATNTFTGPDGTVTTETTYFVQTPSIASHVETVTTTTILGTDNTITSPTLQTIYTPVTITVEDVTVTSRTTIRTSVTTLFRTEGNGNIVEIDETEYYVAIPETVSMLVQGSSIGRSSTLAGQFRYPTKKGSSTATAGISQYQGNGVSMSQKMYSFVFVFCFSLLFL